MYPPSFLIIILPVCCAAPVGTLIHFGPLTFIICCTLLLRAGPALLLFSLMIHDVHMRVVLVFLSPASPDLLIIMLMMTSINC